MEVDSVDAQDNEPEKEVSLGLHIILVFFFDDHALDVIKWFDALLVAINRVLIVNPDDIFLLERGFLSLYLRISLHLFRIHFKRL